MKTINSIWCSLIGLILIFSTSIRTEAASIPIAIYSPDFSAAYVGNWQLNGNSTVVNNAMQLTPDQLNQRGTIFWTSKVCNPNDFGFSAYFTFKMVKTNSQADGITFILQQYSNTFGALGGGIGYQGLPDKSIAIEFDTYQNGYDADNGHIALDINGSVDHAANQTYTGQSNMVVPKATLTGMGINLVDGALKHAWVDYDGTKLQVRISNTSARPVSPILDITYDLTSYFTGASIFYGFGAATGASREEHYINSAIISNKYQPIDVVNNTYYLGLFSTHSSITASICEGESYAWNGNSYTADGTYTLSFTNAAGCDSTATLILDVRPLQTTWTGLVSNDWLDDANWNPKHPTACTHVIIPNIAGGVKYPIILGSAACKSITFEPGGAVLGLQYLTYTQAIVQLSLQRDKWYTLTAPLKNMYSGDYYFEGQPKTQMKLFDDVNPDRIAEGVVVGNWTHSFANLAVPLTPGMGFAFMVDTLSFDYPNGTITSHSDYFNSFPRRNGNGSLVRKAIPYSAVTGKLYPNLAQSMTKDSSIAFRFAMENASAQLEDVAVPIKQGLNLVGNPLMTHLDFDLLYNSNIDKISDNLKFWNGTTFVSYMSAAQIASTLDKSFVHIPPMQAFFVYGLETADTQLDINLNEHFIKDESTQLRAASTAGKALYVKSSMNGYQSFAAIAQNPSATCFYGKDDAFKLFTQFEQVPEVYTVVDGHEVDINQFDSIPYMAPIGIKTSSRGEILLSFTGASNFEGMDVTLVNTVTGEEQNLKADNVYKLNYDTIMSDASLFVEFRSANTTGLSKENNSCSRNKCVQVFAKDKSTISVIGNAGEKIKKVQIYDLNGKQLFGKADINSIEFNVNLPLPRDIVVVQVESERRSYRVKVLMK